MLKLFTYSWFWFLCFLLFCILGSACFAVLVHIKKTEFRNLYNKDAKAETFWTSQERTMWDDLLWKTPYWVEYDKRAKVCLYLFRLFIMLAASIWAFPILFIVIAFFS